CRRRADTRWEGVPEHYGNVPVWPRRRPKSSAWTKYNHRCHCDERPIRQNANDKDRGNGPRRYGTSDQSDSYSGGWRHAVRPLNRNIYCPGQPRCHRRTCRRSGFRSNPPRGHQSKARCRNRELSERALEPMAQEIQQIRGWVDASRRIVALTGAGISTESGIPDFRGPQGVWTRDPKAEKLSNIQHYMADPEVRRLAWQSRLDHPAWTAGPNAGHRALVELERRGILHALVTQNIDGLHQMAGHASEMVIEVHGTMREVMCMACGWRGPMGLAIDRVRAGEED